MRCCAIFFYVWSSKLNEFNTYLSGANCNAVKFPKKCNFLDCAPAILVALKEQRLETKPNFSLDHKPKLGLYHISIVYNP